VTPPTVSVCIPTLNEEAHIEDCLRAIEHQTYPNIVEVFVIDGGSTDRTRELAAAHAGVVVLDNPRRIQAAALNIGLARASGEIFVRVDAHCVVAPDYVARCVEALARTDAAVVGGMMVPRAQGGLQRGIAEAMASRLGAGPARFHVGGPPGWVDTVYLGAFRTSLGRCLGGYDERVLVNEDAEFAFRASRCGGVWFDPSIRATYRPRPGLRALARQFHRYGRGRARTVVKHPASLRPRQLVAPALLVGLLSPKRRTVATAYAVLVAGRAIEAARRGGDVAAGVALALPTMHVSWATGFVAELAYQIVRPPRR